MNKLNSRSASQNCLGLSLALAFLIMLPVSCSREKKADISSAQMQDFVVHIAEYARQFDPDFIIIPQNGVELCFNHTDSSSGFHNLYRSSIDGLGIEELFYNGDYSPDEERIRLLRKCQTSKKILVSEYVSNSTHLKDAYAKNQQEGFICFARTAGNYHYQQIPDTVPGENSSDISTLADAQNFLYLISTDLFASKQAMLNAIKATNFDVILIDLFFDGEALDSTEIQQLKIKNNGGQRLVIAYVSVGSAENFRYYWQDGWSLHHPSWLKKKYEGYEDEYWVEFWEKDWQDIIYGNDDSYVKRILNAGFDGAYLDNVEAYYFLYFNN
ncbi:MAG TPA: endo alpha-1,4 polygalactosaminidase [Bacteroidales bacterium]|nr:endo alpha-1,4 polygalactosaminidase [Bacteroidales bacterium]HRZ48556.1 endo alpha-1,4 polygalactosaminidase [Bacteroidales bacterium]